MKAWDSDSILALAPDAASAKAGIGLANPGKWPLLGGDERAIWGLAQGSGKEPYQTAIDLAEPAFKCSCPSRKFPCKHGLGLFLLYARGMCPAGPRPAWCEEWLAKRDAKASAPPKAESAPDPAAAPDPARAKRAAKRDERVADGLRELSTFLHDVVRQGLAAAAADLPAWDRMAARLVDAQAPGAARLVREAGGLPGSDAAAQSRRLARLGQLHLLAEAYPRIESLPPETQADLRAAVGWTLRVEELDLAAAVEDHWTVTMRHVYEEDRLRVQRAWLYGRESRRWALSLTFAAGAAPFEPTLATGSAFRGRLAFYPGAVPLRAAILEARPDRAEAPPVGSAQEGLRAYAEALARQPWLEAFPVAIEGVRLAGPTGGWQAVDEDGTRLPATIPDASVWPFLAWSGGRAGRMYGEWDGDRLRPLTAILENRWVRL